MLSAGGDQPGAATGIQDYAHPSPLMRVFLWLIGSPRDREETAARQIVRLGYTVEDVRHIVLTHLNLDHAGGLRDFPGAQVHLFRREYEAAAHPHSLVERGCDDLSGPMGQNRSFTTRAVRSGTGSTAYGSSKGSRPKFCSSPCLGVLSARTCRVCLSSNANTAIKSASSARTTSTALPDTKTNSRTLSTIGICSQAHGTGTCLSDWFDRLRLSKRA